MESIMKYILWGLFWIIVYLVLVLAPLLILLFFSIPMGRGFGWDFSIALGFAGAAMMAVMFFLTARFKRASLPFGIDLVYYFHRQISLVLLLFITAHPILLYAIYPGLLNDLHPSRLPTYLMTGIGSYIALLLLVISSLGRKQLRIHYDTWRVWHAALAVIALVLAIAHIVGVRNYLTTLTKQVLWVAITASWLLLLLYIRLIKPFFILRRPYCVEKISPERGDTWTLEIVPVGHSGIRFAPGQFAWLTLFHSPFALKEHPFSIASSAEHPEKICFSIKELGDFTRQIKQVRPGETAYLDAPYGSFTIDRHPAPGFVFIAGGIGIAPIMGMLRTLADRRDSRPLLLFYAYNTLERLTFYEELEQLRQTLRLRVVYVLFDPPTGWQGEKGFITAPMLKKYLPNNLADLQYFVCGPVPLIHLVEKGLHRHGVPLSHIHSELFDLV